MSTAFTTGPALFHSQNWSVSQEWPSRSLPMATASDSGRPVLPVARPARQSCARAAKVVQVRSPENSAIHFTCKSLVLNSN